MPSESTPNYTTNKPNFTLQIQNYRGRGRGRSRPGPKPGIPYPYSKKTGLGLGHNSSRGPKPSPNLPQLNNQKNANQASDPKNSRSKLFVRIISQDTGRPKFVQNLEVLRVICQTYQPQTAPKTATKANHKQKILDMRTFAGSKAPQPKGAAPQDPALMTSATSSAAGGQPDQGNRTGLQSEGKQLRPKLNTNLDTTYICKNRNSVENHPHSVGNPNLVEHPDSSSPDSRLTSPGLDSPGSLSPDSDSGLDSDSDPDSDGDIQMGSKSRNQKTKETKRVTELQNSENKNNFPTKFPPKST